MQLNGVLWACALALAAFFPVAARAASAGEVVLEESVRGCGVRLEARAAEPAAWRLRVPDTCALTPEETRDALGALARRALAGPQPLPPPESFSIGRIVSLPWLSERLAASALAAPGWDAARGAPRSGGPNRFVAERIEAESLHRELVEGLAAGDLRVVGVSVEKVLIGGASDDAAVARAVAAGPGAAGSARLPFDAILWLRLER